MLSVRWMNALLLFGSIVVFFVLFELVLYLSGYDEVMSGTLMRVGDLTEEYGYHTILGEQLETHWGKKNFTLVEEGVEYRLNADGFREERLPAPKRPGVFRIVVLGDSVTFGKGVAQDASYVSLLAQKFVPQKKVEVINLGMTGLSTFEEYLVLRDEGLRYDPDLVILGYVLNDPYVHTGAASQTCDISLVRIPFPCAWKYRLLQVRVVHFVRSRLQSLFYAEDDLATYWADLHHNPRYMQISNQSFAEMAELADQNDFAVLVVIFPLFYDFDKYYWTDVHEIVRNQSSSFGFTTLDLLPAYSTYDAVSLRWKPSDISHPNAQGHQIAADAIYDYLLAYPILRRTASKDI